MTPAEWFANVVLPALVALVGIAASQLFARRIRKKQRHDAATHGLNPAE
jgi:hypothetical protein